MVDKPAIMIRKIDNGWIIGYAGYKGERYNFQLKTFLEKSKYGINKGCISKMYIDKGGKTVVNYDRGWDIRPQTENVKKVYHALLLKFNIRMPERCIIPWMESVGEMGWIDPKTGKEYNTTLYPRPKKPTKWTMPFEL